MAEQPATKPCVTESPADALEGIAAAPGVAVGLAMIVAEHRVCPLRRRLEPGEVRSEVARFDAAVAGLLQELGDAGDAPETRAAAGPEQGAATGVEQDTGDEPNTIARAMLRSYRAVLRDPLLVGGVHERIVSRRSNAEWALEEVVAELRAGFDARPNPALADWWHEVQALTESLLRRLSGGAGARGFPAGAGVVAVAEHVGIGDAIELIRAGGVGIVLEGGSLTSHVAVLCRSAGLPAVVGVAAARERVEAGRRLVVDGDAGRVWHDDDAVPGVRATGQGAEDDGLPLATRCGTPIVLRANLALDLQAERARCAGLRGVGLMRTFYQYVGREALPTEGELAAVYGGVVADFAPEPVTVRLLDLGGSFAAETLPTELLQARDRRGIRLFRDRPEVVRTQLRAICRASARGRLRLLVPFCTEPEEVDAVRAELADATAAVRARGQSVGEIEVGAMVEVPSAVMLADEFARRCDFLAIGSNDLAQYLLAASREEPTAPADRLHPALLLALRLTAAAGRRHRTPVSLCGEIASDPRHVPALLATGLREFSVAPRLATGVRRAIRATDLRRRGGRT